MNLSAIADLRASLSLKIPTIAGGLRRSRQSKVIVSGFALECVLQYSEPSGQYWTIDLLVVRRLGFARLQVSATTKLVEQVIDQAMFRGVSLLFVEMMTPCPRVVGKDEAI